MFCYNVEVAWRDGRVGLRRTTGNRVNPNTVSRVRIPFSPPNKATQKGGFFVYLKKALIAPVTNNYVDTRENKSIHKKKTDTMKNRSFFYV